MNSVYQKETECRKKGTVERVISVLTMIAVVAGIAFGMAGTPAFALNATDLSVDFQGNYSTMQGKEGENFAFKVTNTINDPISFYAQLSGGSDINVTSGNEKATIILEPGKSTTLSFKADIARWASADDHVLTLSLFQSDNNARITDQNVTISVSENLNSQVGKKNAAVDINYKLSNSEGIIAGAENTLSLEIFNRGNTEIKNAQITLGLPDGISINNAAGYINAGYISVGDTYKCQFPLIADESLTSKNYQITVKIAGADSSNDPVSLAQTLYIPVKGTGDTVSAKDVEITNISIPQQVLAGDDFTLAFDVANRGAGKLGDTKVTVEVPDGLANKTKNVFVVTGLASGTTQRCTVTLFGTDKAADNQYKMIKITAESPSGDKTASVSQYAGTMVKSAGTNVKTPQLMISNYSYGGTYVQAGADFALSLGLYNTSATQDLVNVKVTLTADDGTFIPVKSSNAFYIDKIPAKGTVTHGMNLTAKHDADEKTYSLNVDMSYEDASGNAFTSKDVISIPVMQETRLVVDDVVAPPELYAGTQSGLSVSFYNMGKTVLNNLRVNVEGDFDAPQSNMYYVGNMEAGKSDSYDFTFIPRKSGPMSGTITFTYEDAAGKQQRLEKPFEVTIMEDMPMDDPGAMAPPADEKKIPWIPIAAVAVLVAVIAALIVWRRHRKKKLNQEMEIDE